jgi:hypothetical protein
MWRSPGATCARAQKNLTEGISQTAAAAGPPREARFAAKWSLAYACPKGWTPTPSRCSLRRRHQPAAIDGASALLLGHGPGRGVRPTEAIAAELRSASAPDLAMLVGTGRQLRKALG